MNLRCGILKVSILSDDLGWNVHYSVVVVFYLNIVPGQVAFVYIIKNGPIHVEYTVNAKTSLRF